MSHLFRPVFAVLATAVLAVACRAQDGRNASEIEPTENQKGSTADRGPTKYGEYRAKRDSSSSSEKVEKAEVVEEKSEKHEKKHKHRHDDAKEVEVKDEKAAPAPAAPSTAPTAEDEKAMKHSALEFDRKMRSAIRKLSTSGWREAQVELVGAGKPAIPYLIDAMAPGEEEATGEKAPAYNVGGHTKADAGRSPRQRSVAEVASELLTDIVSNHSSYKGELPTVDQKAWQEWWIANGEGVTFGK
jgi:hypothetical protein